VESSKPETNSRFLQDVLQGLTAENKYLQSKYFYDAVGDGLFQKIMGCPEYYLTNCEMEIFREQTRELANVLTGRSDAFDIVELGPGDATKSIHLLKQLASEGIDYTYYPVDISKNVINILSNELPQAIPSLRIKGLNGEYFEMLEKAKTISDKMKVVLLLGSNIGNIPLEQAQQFCSSLRSHLSPGDILVIGFDLVKDPQVILDAYNDKAGFTRDFNLNLLRRINDELNGDFKIDNFRHYPTYDPQTGTCKSFLVSTCKQTFHVSNQPISFSAGECIHMEISQKYSVSQVDALAAACGFTTVRHFVDSKGWFLDVVWQCV
jgi:dimethylhistidine N-methyltransferase